MKFDELGLPEPLLSAVEDLGFEQATPVQEQGLPILLEGRDIAAQAQTGTGKTAAFLLGTLDKLLRGERPADGSPRALVIAPTRELAMQIAADGVQLATYTDIEIALAYGGTNWEAQAKDIQQGVDIVVGTPGRLIDYHKRKVLKLHRIESVVIDEADRMFDMGFIQDLTYLMRRCPRRSERQSMLFSATLSYDVMRLARQYMNDPVRVEIAGNLVVDEVEEELYHVPATRKVELLLGLMAREQPTLSMIFVNRKVDGEMLAWRLNQNGRPAVYISGDLRQNKREKIIEALKNGEISTLVATDVASRGIHVDEVSHVFNYDVPQDPEDYVHRIGRTARAGHTGKAITLACDNYVFCLAAIEKYLDRKVPTRYAEDEWFAIDSSGYFRREPGRPYTGFGEDSRDRSSGGRRRGDRDGDDGGRKRSRRRRSRDDSDAKATTAAPSAPAAAEADAGTTQAKAAEPSAPAARKRQRRRIGDGRGLAEDAQAPAS